RDAVVSRAWPRGVDVGDAGDRRHGRRARKIQSALVLARRAGLRRDVVFGGADAASAAAGSSGSGIEQTGRRGAVALYPLLQRIASAASDERPGGCVRSARARSVWHDRGGASDGLQSAAARRANAWIGWA